VFLRRAEYTWICSVISNQSWDQDGHRFFFSKDIRDIDTGTLTRMEWLHKLDNTIRSAEGDRKCGATCSWRPVKETWRERKW
jgi:hypothetical protein